MKTKTKDLKKDKHKSVRINSIVLKMLTLQGYTLQSFLDEKLDDVINIKVGGKK